MSRPPVIIIGMHRSGTSLLTRVLQQAGFFMGTGASRNEEAAFTNAVNAWLFREASATWDRPESVDWLLADEALRPWLLDYMRDMIEGPASLRFLGIRRGLRGWGLAKQSTPWGWKDPRNTFTLPLWLELFPDARVLHIVRHGADVAASLRSRRSEVFDQRRARYRKYRPAHRLDPFAPRRRGFAPQVRCGTLEGGLELWAQYVARARQHVRALDERALEISYESLLAAPKDTLDQALQFCDCPLDTERLAMTAATFRPDRAHAWHRDPELRAFAERHHKTLQAQGYDAHPPTSPIPAPLSP
ncbi:MULTISPECIES: sulfotransferase [unclassified Thioalkalivibrio]|uniref:sulfotransferase family protein n=1 Tax=unclassified Thioalkalivibrio TaxID=2621013 RepID=UPI000367313E|nr:MULTISPECIES: sulfotransferase [unclassified Thioalkalivibrio]